MNRQEKEKVVTVFSDLFKQTKATFLINYRGLDVQLMQDLRKSLREEESVLKVTKARLMKLAAQNVKQDVEGVELFQEDFKEQVGLVFAKNDVPPVAKKLVDFAKENEQLSVLTALFESKVMSREEVLVLASLPSRDVLLATLVMAMQGPVMQLARSLQMILGQFVHALESVCKQKEKNG